MPNVSNAGAQPCDDERGHSNVVVPTHDASPNEQLGGLEVVAAQVQEVPSDTNTRQPEGTFQPSTSGGHSEADMLRQIIAQKQRIIELQSEVEKQQRARIALLEENNAITRALQTDRETRSPANAPPAQASASRGLSDREPDSISLAASNFAPAQSYRAVMNIPPRSTQMQTATTTSVPTYVNAGPSTGAYHQPSTWVTSATADTMRMTTASPFYENGHPSITNTTSYTPLGYVPSASIAATTLPNAAHPSSTNSAPTFAPTASSQGSVYGSYDRWQHYAPASTRYQPNNVHQSAAFTSMPISHVPTASTASGQPISSVAAGSSASAPSATSSVYQPYVAGQVYVPPVPQNDVRSMAFRRMHDLPSFSGLPAEWPRFICAYEATTAQFGYNDLENMLRLQKCLTGDAKRRVDSLLIRPEHVWRAIDALAKTFGRSELLVESQIMGARQLPEIEDGHLDEIISFSVSVDGLVTFLDCAETEHHLMNPTLLNELERKLPFGERLKWAEVARIIYPRATVRDFALWLGERATLIGSITSSATAETMSTHNGSHKASRGKHVLLNVAAESLNSKRACSFCSEAHDVHHCDRFRRLSVDERFNEIRSHPLCFGCLGVGHMLPSCPSKLMCGVDGCDKWHDPLLHKGTLQAASSDRSSSRRRGARNDSGGQHNGSTSSQTNGVYNVTTPMPRETQINNASSTDNNVVNETAGHPTVLTCKPARNDRNVFYRIVPVTLHSKQRQINTFAFLDEGSSATLIDDSLADELQLDGAESPFHMIVLGDQPVSEMSRSVALGISGMQKDAMRFDISGVRTTKHIPRVLPKQSIGRRAIVDEYPHLHDVPFDSFENAEPRILIGLDNHHLGVPSLVRNSAAGGIVATLTPLGWVLYGSNNAQTLPGAVVLHVREAESDVDEQYTQLNELVRHHFTTEAFGTKVPSAEIESDDIKRARELLSSTTKRVGTRFETGLLWKRDGIVLPNSYAMALKRLVSVESKMRRDPEYARQYREQIEAYLQKGYARKLTAREAEQQSDRTWFLPHFAVQNINKPGRFRLVFDAAAIAHGTSLNAALLAGPDINVPLTRLLFQFRLGIVGVCADVREMYHQVRIRSEDQDAQRFLWRDGNPQTEPDVYIMNVMTFGSTCSPASAQYVKNVNATEFEHEMPEAADAIRQRHYVDDFVASFASEEDANRVTADVIELHKRGGFDLRGVVSNSVAVRTRFDAAQQTDQTVSLEPQALTQKILGMTWETSDDTFRFRTRFGKVKPEVINGSRRPSKREVLSVAMSIFDPFGFLADFVLAAKTLLLPEPVSRGMRRFRRIWTDFGKRGVLSWKAYDR